MPPRWTRQNLEGHWKKHGKCFDDLCDRQLSMTEYESESLSVFRAAWSEYEAQELDYKGNYFRQPRAYYTDARLCLAITDIRREDFVTCFHKHFWGDHGVSPRRGETVGSLKLQYNSYVGKKQRAGDIINLRRIRCV